MQEYILADMACSGWALYLFEHKTLKDHKNAFLHDGRSVRRLVRRASFESLLAAGMIEEEARPHPKGWRPFHLTEKGRQTDAMIGSRLRRK